MWAGLPVLPWQYQGFEKNRKKGGGAGGKKAYAKPFRRPTPHRNS